MPNAILDGLSLVDTTGRLILAVNIASLVACIVAHVALRARYSAIERDLERNAEAAHFFEPVLVRIVRDTRAASADDSAQAIIEDAFHSELKGSLLAERFVRSATGLALVLGLLGTFYGLTLSIGKLARLVGPDSGAVGDVTQALTIGLTQALGGMAVAFSNSLLGVGAAVVLTVLSVLNNVTDRRTALMVRVETLVDRLLPHRARAGGQAGPTAAFADAVTRLETTVSRFDAALQRFAADTNNLRDVQLVVSVKPREGG